MFKVSKQKNHWVMQLDMEMIPENEVYGGLLYKWSTGDIQVLEQELQDKPGVRRMSYDMWWWTSECDLEKFMTYWHLKYGGK